MNIVFPTKEDNPNLDSLLEPVFGNAKTYMIFGGDINDYTVVKNETKPDEICHMGHVFKEHNVDTVISCQLCIHCMENLRMLNIDAWKCDGSANVRESYNKYIIGGIFQRTKPDIATCHHSGVKEAVTPNT